MYDLASVCVYMCVCVCYIFFPVNLYTISV